MGVNKLYEVACDIPNCGDVCADIGRSHNEATERAEILGWDRRIVQERTLWCCPRHAKLTVREIGERLKAARHREAVTLGRST